MSSHSIPARLFVILARDASRAVVFRRGPSAQVALILWRTDDDSFEVGQWFKGRIYERRCDLSPRGDKLIYFAGFKMPLRTWTAVSTPPWLTAVALWPKGDAWGGGGLFESETWISLNHRPEEMRLDERFQLPRHLTVAPLGQYSGGGEDEPIYQTRLTRDGWQVISEGTQLLRPDHFAYDPPQVLSRAAPRNLRLELVMRKLSVAKRGGPWYELEHALVDRQTGTETPIARAEWADWDRSGDLLFAREGKLFRLALGHEAPVDLDMARELVDLSALQFERKRAPIDALSW